MKNIHLCLQLIFIFYSARAMEPVDPGMVNINTWKDAAPFEYKIVVYRSDNSKYPLAQCIAAHTLNNMQFKYGYIGCLLAQGGVKVNYLLTQIVETGTQGISFPLGCPVWGNMEIRCASEEEVIALHQTIENKQDNFATNLFDLRTQLALLEEQYGFELQKRKLR